uniref:Uncharacterized protein n=1 Tax=biofilter metagenome TaxID=1070537 RepID=A0A193SBF1_9ZZZZ
MTSLIDRLSRLDGPCNRTDVLIEVALFKANNIYRSIRANAAGTKVIYTKRDGTQETYWAQDYTLTPERRAESIELLRAKVASR